MTFSRAVVRMPAPSFASGLSTSSLGPPDLPRALEQHGLYVRALRDGGLEVTALPPDEAFPDGTFVEDTAIATGRGVVLTNPGAPSRAGEVPGVAVALSEFYSDAPSIAAPGTVDGGDICEVDGHFLIGISARTNEHGAAQLAAILSGWGYTSARIDIRGNRTLLHLKSGIAYLEDGLWVSDASFTDELRGLTRSHVRDIITVSPEEAYGANCIRVNDAVFIAHGHPGLRSALEIRGCRVVSLDMSEFKKMDGGLSCLSLRF